MDIAADRERVIAALSRIAAGDEAALRLLYDQTSAKLFGICLRILRDRTAAEDVLQEVYVAVWRRAGAFDATRGVSPITWLAALARNRAIDRLRTRKAHLDRPLEQAAQIADSAPLATVVIERAETSRRLENCMDELDPRHADYLRSAFFDGHTYPSLAEAAGVPLGTMKSWIRRALLRLRACLDA